MARDFSSKDAKQLIQEHLDLLKTLNELAESSHLIRREIHNSDRFLTESLDHIIPHEIEFSNKYNIPSPAIEHFISSLYFYQKMLHCSALTYQIMFFSHP